MLHPSLHDSAGRTAAYDSSRDAESPPLSPGSDPEEETGSAPCKPAAAGGGTQAGCKYVPHSLKPKHVVEKRNARERRRVQVGGYYVIFYSLSLLIIW